MRSKIAFLLRIIEELFQKYFKDVYAYVAMARVLPYVYIVSVGQLWETLGYWFAFDAGLVIVLTAIACGIKNPTLLTVVGTVLMTGLLSVLTIYSFVGVNTESASLTVFVFMFADSILSFVLLLASKSITPVIEK